MSFYVQIPVTHTAAPDDVIISVFYVIGDPGTLYPKITPKVDVICFKNIPNVEFYYHMRKTWKSLYPYSVCHFGCKQALFSLHKIKCSYRYPAHFQENLGNDIGVYEMKINSRRMSIYVTNFTRSLAPSKETINVRTMLYRSLHAYNIAQLMKTTRNDSHYQILIGNLKLTDNNLPRQTLAHIAGMILPRRASILYGTQSGFKLRITDCRTIHNRRKNFFCNSYLIKFTERNCDPPIRNSLVKKLTVLTHCIAYIDHLINFNERSQSYESILYFFVTILINVYYFNTADSLTLNTWFFGIMFFILPLIFNHFTYKRVERINKPLEDDKAKLITEMFK